MPQRVTSILTILLIVATVLLDYTMAKNATQHAIENSTTTYIKSVKVPNTTVLKEGRNNDKLGWIITKTKWRGKRMYSLTLEERATCPPTCHHWDDCYGNNMPFAHRFSHGPELLKAIDDQLQTLTDKWPEGIVVRLHVLGDFWNRAYVNFWAIMLNKYPTLCIFGYTAHYLTHPMRHAIDSLNLCSNDRSMIRYSYNGTYDPIMPHRKFAATEDYKGDTFDCPEQTDRIDSCANCGACFNKRITKTVRFLDH